LLAQHTDPEQVDVYRKCVYGFSAVVAERFRDGRVFLAGDAAHMTPPFAGQGLNAGIRDVRNLHWKLARVLDGTLPETLLDSYQLERHDAAREMVDVAVLLGGQIQPTDAAAAAERDAMFAALNEDPAAARAFSEDVIAPLRDVRMATGWLGDDDCAGRFLPQPTVDKDGKRCLLDDTLGGRFSALVKGSSNIPQAVAAHPLWQAMSPSLHALPEALEEFARLPHGGVLLIRPDRFVLAALRESADALQQLDALAALLAGEPARSAASA
jgi:3-(3-hydroxy-phenyl)propionate hydroxylase